MRRQKIDADAAKLRRAYYKEWRAKNREKVKAYNAKYWRKKVEKAVKDGER